MPATLPIPITFELPSPDWAPRDPDAAGVRNAAFLAVREVPGDYAPVLSIAGDFRDDAATLEDIADEALQLRTAEVGGPVRVLHRALVGSAKVPALLHVLGFDLTAAGRSFALVQAQVFMAVPAAVPPQRSPQEAPGGPVVPAQATGSVSEQQPAQDPAADEPQIRRVVLVFAMTAERDQAASMLEELQRFVQSVQPQT
ncbi:MAG: hypothetical protein CSA58_10075 [Micrococcales bacterium]|nr:MAG: hypothetical protein CSB46_03400 [Micrococcales bacterium]PIE26330.1 MAG: hypothetical protein CSA58_10075 [Micrococcales bacterium]